MRSTLKPEIFRISVIMPSHNNGEEIHEAIQSILNQTMIRNGSAEAEIIIVDDASRPACASFLDTLPESYPVVRIIHLKENVGPSAARNNGIREASHMYIGFLDGDDKWPENKLELQVPYFRDPELAIIGGKIRYFSDDGSSLPDLQFENNNELAHVHLGAIIARKEIFQAGLFFDEQLRYSEDVNWWMQVRERSLKFFIIEEACLLYRIHGSNMTKNKTIEDLQLLRVLHLSLKRRRTQTGEAKELPQMSNFRLQSFPQVDVLIPVYNGARFIRESVETVLNQGWPNKRVIVINDGSTDNTGDILSELAAVHNNLVVISQAKKGVNAALNKGLALSNAPYIAFIDSDDLWEQRKLDTQMKALLAEPDMMYCVTQIKEFESLEDPLKSRFHARQEILKGYNRTTFLARTELFTTFGHFDEEVVAGDFIAWFSPLIQKGIKGKLIPEVLAYRRIHENNLTGRIQKEDYLKILRKHLDQKRMHAAKA